eukprot:5877152-Prymnesium_polylepis.1
MALTLADEGRRSSLLLAFTGCAFVNGLLSSSAAGCAGGAATMIASLIFNSTRAVFFFTCAADAATAAAIFTLLLLSQLTFIVIGTTTGLQHDLARLKTGHFVDNHGESFSLCFGLAVMQFSWLLMGVRAEPFFEMVIALLVWMIGLPMAFPGIVAKHRQRGLDQTNEAFYNQSGLVATVVGVATTLIRSDGARRDRVARGRVPGAPPRASCRPPRRSQT